MWPFRKTEARADATVEIVNRIEAEAGGTVADPGALAIAESCIGLWERAIQAATVTPASMALLPVNPVVLALAGRSLAARGEFVAIIDTSGDGLKLIPASGWDVRGFADPETWFYRVDQIGPSGSVTDTHSGAAVLHFRIGADSRTPWRGQSPLRRASASGELAARVEASLSKEMKMPVTALVTLVGTPDQTGTRAANIRKGGVVVADVGLASGGLQPTPGRHFTPARLQPSPDTVTEALRTQTGRDIANAFGISPTLFNASGDGAGQREAWRRFWTGTIEPVGRMIQTELRAKLDPAAMVGFEALRASDEDGRSRAVSRRAAAYKTFRDAGKDDAEAMRLAGLE